MERVGSVGGVGAAKDADKGVLSKLWDGWKKFMSDEPAPGARDNRIPVAELAPASAGESMQQMKAGCSKETARVLRAMQKIS